MDSQQAPLVFKLVDSLPSIQVVQVCFLGWQYLKLYKMAAANPMDMRRMNKARYKTKAVDV